MTWGPIHLDAVLLLREARAGILTWVVYGYHLARGGSDCESFESRSKMAKRLDCSEQAIRRAEYALRDLGLITIDSRRSGRTVHVRATADRATAVQVSCSPIVRATADHAIGPQLTTIKEPRKEPEDTTHEAEAPSSRLGPQAIQSWNDTARRCKDLKSAGAMPPAPVVQTIEAACLDWGGLETWTAGLTALETIGEKQRSYCRIRTVLDFASRSKSSPDKGPWFWRLADGEHESWKKANGVERRDGTAIELARRMVKELSWLPDDDVRQYIIDEVKIHHPSEDPGAVVREVGL
jgi:hypothetical protein